MPCGVAQEPCFCPVNTDGTQLSARAEWSLICLQLIPFAHLLPKTLSLINKEVIVKLTVQICALMLLAMFMSACQAPAPPALSDADVAAIRTANASYASAVKARDWAALAALYAQDAIILPPNHPPVTGRADIKAYFEGFPPMSAFEVPAVEIEGRGDLALIRGTYSMTINQEGAAPVTDSGKWMEMRRKHADGSWLILRDIWNSDVAMQQ